MKESCLDEKLQSYQEILATGEYQNQVQLANNLVVLRSQVKSETHYSDSIRRLEEHVHSKEVLSLSQLKSIKTNKLAFSLMKNKIEESAKIVQEMKSVYQEDPEFLALEMLYHLKSKQTHLVQGEASLLKAEVFRQTGDVPACFQTLRTLYSQERHPLVLGYLLVLMTTHKDTLDQSLLQDAMSQVDLGLLRLAGHCLLAHEMYS